MTLFAALIGGLVCGYLLGWRAKAVLTWLAIWVVVLVAQTAAFVDPDNRDDWSYWPVQAAILVLAIGMIRLGAFLRARRSRATKENSV